MKESTRVLVALGLGLGGGAAIAASGNPDLLRAADSVAPIGTLWVNAIRMTIIPLIVSLLITGLAGNTDLGAVGRLGRRTVVVFLGLLTGVTVVMLPLVAAAFSLLGDPATRPALPAGAAEAASQLAATDQPLGFGAWIVTMIPANPIAAAADGAMLPLIVFSLLFALAIGRSPAASRDQLLGFFRALGDAMLVLVHWVVLAAPIGIFGLVLPLAAHAGIGMAGAVGFYIVVYAAASLVGSALLYPVMATLGGVSLGRFSRAALPAQLIGFSSASSVATLPAMVDAAEQGLGLSPRVSGFVLPLAVSTFKLAAPVSWTAGAMFVGWFYGVDLGVLELSIIGLAGIFLAFAAPGVPRGAFLMLTPLFLAIGLPAEGIGILIAVDAIPDAFATILNVTGDLAATVLVDRRAGAS
ncbi:MAG: dicarboxylate/amino acid:cation symporter [Gemmatimonadales bacterium]